MIVRSATRVLVVLAATAAWAQNPGTTPGAPILNLQGPPGPVGRRGAVANKAAAADPQGLFAMRERVADMEGTLTRMRGVLKKMHTNAAQSKPMDSLTQANLDLWELMVGQLDKDLLQLRLTLTAREDLEARRAALYRQADAKNAAAVQAARAAQEARFAEAARNASGATGPTTGQSASPAAQTAPAQPSGAPATNNSASPN